MTMTSSEYISGFFGIVIGMSITELLRGIYKIMINSKKVTYFIPHGIGLAAFFLTIIIFFFDYFRLLKLTTEWTPITLILHTLPLALVFFVSMMFFPSFKEDRIDFKEFTKSSGPKLYLAGLSVSLFLIIRNFTVLTDDSFSINHSIPLLILLPFFLLGWIYRKADWVYYVVNSAMLIIVLVLATIFKV